MVILSWVQSEWLSTCSWNQLQWGFQDNFLCFHSRHSHQYRPQVHPVEPEIRTHLSCASQGRVPKKFLSTKEGDLTQKKSSSFAKKKKNGCSRVFMQNKVTSKFVLEELSAFLVDTRLRMQGTHCGGKGYPSRFCPHFPTSQISASV